MMNTTVVHDENDPEVYRLSKNIQSISTGLLSGTKKVMTISEQERKMDGAPVGDLFDIDVKENADLKPYPPEALDNLISAMTLEETCASSWADQFEDIEKIRRVILHHPDLLNSPEAMSLAVNIIVDCGLGSLRSSCIKNALQCSASLLSSYSYSLLGPHMELVVSAMLLKAVSGPKFMCKLADTCLTKALRFDPHGQSPIVPSSSSSAPTAEEAEGYTYSSIDSLEVLSADCFTLHKSADVITLVHKYLVIGLAEFIAVYCTADSPAASTASASGSAESVRRPRQATLSKDSFARTHGIMAGIAGRCVHCIYQSTNTKQAKTKEYARQALKLIALTVCPVLFKIQPDDGSMPALEEEEEKETAVPAATATGRSEADAAPVPGVPVYSDAKQMFEEMYKPFASAAQQAEIAKLVSPTVPSSRAATGGVPTRHRVPVKAGILAAKLKTSSRAKAAITSSAPVTAPATIAPAATTAPSSVFCLPTAIGNDVTVPGIIVTGTALPPAPIRLAGKVAAPAPTARAVKVCETQSTTVAVATRRKRCFSDCSGSSSGSNLILSRKNSAKVVIFCDTEKESENSLSPITRSRSGSGFSSGTTQ